jgi:hypothetical protein
MAGHTGFRSLGRRHAPTSGCTLYSLARKPSDGTAAQARSDPSPICQPQLSPPRSPREIKVKHYVYVLRSVADGQFYVGLTNNLPARLPAAAILAGLVIALIGSVLLYLNAGSLLEETSEGDITFTHPTHVARERRRARLGFSLVALGFLLQAIGVAVPLLTAPAKSQPPSPTAAVVRRQQPPSATEVFSLKSKCVELGEKILEETPVGSALSQSQVSHYDIDSGRCYVEVTVTTADTTVPRSVYHRYLYDRQTRDLLAYQSMEHGQKAGIVYKKGILGFDQVGEYIDIIMKED